MKKRNKNTKKDVLFILISSFIVVVAWIGFNIYHIYVTSTVKEAIRLQLTPISGTFDQATIQQLKSRENIVPLYTGITTAASEAAKPTPTPPAYPQPSASGSSRFAPTNTPINRQGQ